MTALHNTVVLTACLGFASLALGAGPGPGSGSGDHAEASAATPARDALPTQAPRAQPWAWSIDSLMPRQSITGDIRARLEGFDEIDHGPPMTYTARRSNLDAGHMVSLKVTASPRAGLNPPVIRRVDRKVIAWKGVSAADLMNDAKRRHGGTPTCGAVEGLAGLSHDGVLGHMVSALHLSGIIKAQAQRAPEASDDIKGTACIWGAAQHLDGGRLICRGDCLMVSISQPLPGSPLLRMDETAYAPLLGRPPAESGNTPGESGHANTNEKILE